LSVLLSGCAGLVQDKEGVAVEGREGTFQVRKGRPGFVIGAPHGTSDKDTDLIATDLAGLTGFGVVVATGFAHVDAAGQRFNVNRPTMSVSGAPPGTESGSEEARRVYEAYRRHVAEAAQGPLSLYVEIHGNANAASAGRVEVATVGLGRDDAWRLKTLFELIRDAHLTDPAVPRLEIWVETIDPVRYTASASKQMGMLGTAPRALHIELPRPARTTYREAYTKLLAAFLSESATLLVPRER
jgi:hypothetical protein